MKVGLLTVRLRLHAPNSLKEKRSLVKGWVSQFQRQFNLSVAEVAQQDDKRAATLGMAVVANDSAFLYRTLARVVRAFERLPACNVEETHMEVI